MCEIRFLARLIFQRLLYFPGLFWLLRRFLAYLAWHILAYCLNMLIKSRWFQRNIIVDINGHIRFIMFYHRRRWNCPDKIQKVRYDHATYKQSSSSMTIGEPVSVRISSWFAIWATASSIASTKLICLQENAPGHEEPPYRLGKSLYHQWLLK